MICTKRDAGPLAALFLLGALSPPVRAQKPGGFHVTEWSGEYGLTSQYLDETHSSLTSTLQQRELLFREEFMIASHGYYYHPRLVDWNASLTLSLEQRRIHNQGPVPTSKIDSQGTAWDLRANLFREQPYSGDVYTFRHENQTKQAFFNTTRAIITESGFNVQAHDWSLPSHLHYHHYQYEGKSFDTQREKRDNLLLEGGNNDRKERFEYLGELNHVDRSSSGLTYNDFNFTSSYNREFDRDQWYSSLRTRYQRGSIDTDNSDIGTAYTHYWSDHLQSSHEIRLTENRVLGSSSNSLDLSSGLQHQLWESLRSAASVTSTTTDLDVGSIQRIGGQGTVDYTKKTPIGVLGLGLGAEYYVQDQDALQANAAVLDEPHTFTAGTPLLLDTAHVIASSIVVTDATGLTVYTEGSDYLVSTVGVVTKIDIPVGSLITNGQALLFDYQFEPSPAVRFDSFQRDARASLRVADVADIIMSHSVSSQSVLAGSSDGTIQDSSRSSVQLDTYPYGTTTGVSWEKFVSEFAPYERASFYSRAGTSTESGIFLSASGEVYRTRFSDTDGVERGTSLSASASRSLSDVSYWEVSAQARSVDLVSDAGQGIFVEGRLGRRFRELNFLFSVSYSDEVFDIASDQNQVVLSASVTRSF